MPGEAEREHPLVVFTQGLSNIADSNSLGSGEDQATAQQTGGPGVGGSSEGSAVSAAPTGGADKGQAVGDEGTKSPNWHKDEVLAAVEACLSAQDAAGESTVNERRFMVNDRYQQICLRMQQDGEWSCKYTPEQSVALRCVDTAVKGSHTSKDTAVHDKFVIVARDCRNQMMTFFNQETQENPAGSGVREIKTGRTVEDVLNAIQAKCWAKWGPATGKRGPMKDKWVCVAFEVFKKFGPELIGGSGEKFCRIVQPPFLPTRINVHAYERGR